MVEKLTMKMMGQPVWSVTKCRNYINYILHERLLRVDKAKKAGEKKRYMEGAGPGVKETKLNSINSGCVDTAKSKIIRS